MTPVSSERACGAHSVPPLRISAHALGVIFILCFEVVENKEDIRHFRTPAACITDAIATLIREKEEVVHAEQWRKRQEEQATERATKQAEQQRKEEIALAMQHGMEGR